MIIQNFWYKRNPLISLSEYSVNFLGVLEIPIPVKIVASFNNGLIS